VPHKRRAYGLTEARRRDGVGRSHCPYKHVDPEVITRGRRQSLERRLDEQKEP
jgi:hypothetical protein